MHGAAHDELADDHPHHDLADRAQLRAHLGVAWRLMRDNRPVMVALFESALAGGPATEAMWDRLAEDTSVLRAHLAEMRAQGRPLPGPATLVAAAMGGVLSILAYALTPETTPYTDDEVVDTLTDLLLHGLAGR
jgi:hypothetical protein